MKQTFIYFNQNISPTVHYRPSYLKNECTIIRKSLIDKNKDNKSCEECKNDNSIIVHLKCVDWRG